MTLIGKSGEKKTQYVAYVAAGNQITVSVSIRTKRWNLYIYAISGAMYWKFSSLQMLLRSRENGRNQMDTFQVIFSTEIKVT